MLPQCSVVFATTKFSVGQITKILFQFQHGVGGKVSSGVQFLTTDFFCFTETAATEYAKVTLITRLA